jgi:hypothetical protein
VTFGGHTISHTLDLTVNTLGGNDVITNAGATRVPVRLLGGPGSDTVVGPDGDNQWLLRGTNGGTLNSLVTFTETENLRGGAAADAFLFGLGSVTGAVNGGGGGGTLDYTNDFGPVTINLQSGTAPFIAGGFANITGVIGTDSIADVLIGRNLPTVWNLAAMNAGQIVGSLAQSAVSFFGFENLRGGTAADTFRLGNAGRVSGTVDGGGGVALFGLPFPVDALDYSLRSTGVVVDLTRGLTPGVERALGIEGVTGSPQDDLLRGDARANVLVGGGGSDVLVGEDGNDKLVAGNTGRCVVIGGRGQDTLVGGNPSFDPLTRTQFDGSDLLIGGRTNFDEDDQALAAIINGWRRRDRTYAQRVQDLRVGVPVGAGVVARLTTATVSDDGAADRMAGRGGDDWFWGLAIEATDRSRGDVTSQGGGPEFLN